MFPPRPTRRPPRPIRPGSSRDRSAAEGQPLNYDDHLRPSGPAPRELRFFVQALDPDYRANGKYVRGAIEAHLAADDFRVAYGSDEGGASVTITVVGESSTIALMRRHGVIDSQRVARWEALPDYNWKQTIPSHKCVK